MVVSAKKSEKSTKHHLGKNAAKTDDRGAGESVPLSDVVLWLPEQPGLPNDEPVIPLNQRIVELRMKDNVWHPQRVILQRGQHLKVINEDPHSHTGFLNILGIKGGRFVFGNDLTLWGERSIAWRSSPLTFEDLPPFPFPAFTKTSGPDGPEPVTFFVCPTPYWATTNSDGDFALKRLPAGKWKVRVWHKNFGFIGVVVADGRKECREKGEFTVTVKSGATTNVGVTTVLEHEETERDDRRTREFFEELKRAGRTGHSR